MLPLRNLALAVLLAAALRVPVAAAQGFSMQPSEELSRPLPHPAHRQPPRTPRPPRAMPRFARPLHDPAAPPPPQTPLRP